MNLDQQYCEGIEVLSQYIDINKKSKLLLWLYLNQSHGVNLGEDPDEYSDLTVFVNAQSKSFKKEPNNILGAIQFSPVEIRKRSNTWDIRQGLPPGYCTVDLAGSRVLMDSGAFPEVRINCRVSPKESLDRQIKIYQEKDIKPKEMWIVSYDRLIDEKHIGGDRVKERWTTSEAEVAISQTVEAAEYLNSQRQKLQDFKLVQSCQGVDAIQYTKCVQQVLQFCSSEDVLGLGGWCILGKQKHWLPTFWETIVDVIPIIASSGMKKIHIFGVTWWKKQKGFLYSPLGSLLWLCKKYDLELSTDSRSPIGKALWKDTKKSGAIHPYWRMNLAITRTILGCLSSRPEFKPPPQIHKQLSLLFC